MTAAGPTHVRQDQPGDPARKSGHATCVLCGTWYGVARSSICLRPTVPHSRLCTYAPPWLKFSTAIGVSDPEPSPNAPWLPVW